MRGRPIQVGDTYGKLTVIKEVDGELRDNRKVWLCQCECGNYKKKNSKYVKMGKGCGYCGLYLDENEKPHNKYDLSGEYGIGYTSNGEEFYFDKEDYEKIYPYCWYKMENGYICYKDEKNILLHRLITDCSDDMIVDHINHNKRDNRKVNLRICDYSKNLINARTAINSSIGLKYIKFNKQCGKYQIIYKKKHMGLFTNIATAYEKLQEIILNDNDDYLYEKSLYKNDIRKMLFIDLDGVVFDTVSTINYLYDLDYCLYKNYKKIDSSNINTYEFSELNCATAEEINLYFCQPRFFENLILMENALDTIHSLQDQYAITFVSIGKQPNLLQKQVWINKNCPGCAFIGVDSDVYDDKSHIDMSEGIFIDDSYKNLKTSNAIENICFGDVYSWNENWQGRRCHNWYDVERFLKGVK